MEVSLEREGMVRYWELRSCMQDRLATVAFPASIRRTVSCQAPTRGDSFPQAQGRAEIRKTRGAWDTWHKGRDVNCTHRASTELGLKQAKVSSLENRNRCGSQELRRKEFQLQCWFEVSAL